MDDVIRHEAERITGNPRRFSRTSRGLTRWVGSLRWVLTLTALGIALLLTVYSMFVYLVAWRRLAVDPQ